MALLIEECMGEDVEGREQQTLMPSCDGVVHVACHGFGTALNLPGAMVQHLVRLRARPSDQAEFGPQARAISFRKPPGRDSRHKR